MVVQILVNLKRRYVMNIITPNQDPLFVACVMTTVWQQVIHLEEHVGIAHPVLLVLVMFVDK